MRGRRSLRPPLFPLPASRLPLPASSHVPRMAERISAWLGPDRETVGLAADGDAVGELARFGVEHINLVVVAAGDPELFSVNADIAHVGTAAARDGPRRHDAV